MEVECEIEFNASTGFSLRSFNELASYGNQKKLRSYAVGEEHS